MKRCKRILLTITAVLLAISLSGCIIIPMTKYYNLPIEEVASVQFYDLRNHADWQMPGFDDKCEPVYTLPEEDIEAFLKDFSKVKFSDTIVIMLASVDPSFSYGNWVVRINFTNGQYTFYSCGGFGETMDASGNTISTTHFYCKEEMLIQLIGKYYEIPPKNE